MTINENGLGYTICNLARERVKQDVEKFLIEKKGYSKEEIIVNYEFDVNVKDNITKAIADIVIRVNGRNAMVIMCAPPSTLVPYEMMALACARVLNIPLAIATEWKETTILDTYTGKVLGKSLEDIPERNRLRLEYKKIPEDKVEKAKRILITYHYVLHCNCSELV
ncbi:MAG TPA: hypothetical protein EYH04_04835 [Archaeoglobus profundus]|nr:hypothetical protein [Archaeoglobus profundus]